MLRPYENKLRRVHEHRPPEIPGPAFHSSSRVHMSIETFTPLPLNIFSTWITLLDPSDVPPGMSPALADVEFFPGGVRTRPGLVSQFSTLPGGPPSVNGLKTYITPNLAEHLIVFDALGNLYVEVSP